MELYVASKCYPEILVYDTTSKILDVTTSTLCCVQLRPEVVEWLNEHIGSWNYSEFDYFAIKLRFKREEDRLAFRLCWL